MLKEVFACLPFVREIGNEGSQRNEFRKLTVSIERETAATVSNAFQKNEVEILKNQIGMSASAAHMQLRRSLKDSLSTLWTRLVFQ